MSNKEKRVLTMMAEGFEKGYLGKEEESAKARVLNSPEPLPNEMKKIRKLYYICWICFGIGIFSDFFLGVGLLALMVIYAIEASIVDHKRDRLRRFKFKIDSDITNDEIFSSMQPVLVKKYGMLVEKNPNGVVSVTHDNHTYDILLQEDGTFILWWTTGKIYLIKYPSYRRILAAMGMIAYEVQQQFLKQAIE